MTVGQIACADLIEGNRVVAIVHDGLREIRRALTIWTAEIANDIGRAVRRFPDVTAVNVVSKVKLPARRMVMQEVHCAAPVDVIRLVAARSFLAYIIGSDDVAKIRKGL